MSASKSGHTDVVQLLLSSVSKVDQQNKVRHSSNLSLASSQQWWPYLKCTCPCYCSVATFNGSQRLIVSNHPILKGGTEGKRAGN